MLVLKNTFVLNISVGSEKRGPAGKSLPELKLIFQIYVPAQLICIFLPGFFKGFNSVTLQHTPEVLFEAIQLHHVEEMIFSPAPCSAGSCFTLLVPGALPTLLPVHSAHLLGRAEGPRSHMD